MTELSFLLDLLLNDKLSKPVREKITARVKEVEELLIAKPMMIPSMHTPQVLPPAKIVNGAMQSPSTIAALERQAAAGLPAPVGEIPGDRSNIAAVVVASPAAAQALHSRQIAVSAAISGKPEAGRTSPRKF